MRLLALADIARAAGLTVVEVSGWQTRGHGEMADDIRTITCHHTAGPAAVADPSPMPSLHTVVYGRPGLSGPLAHFGLGRDGTVYVIAAGLCWHAGQSRHIDHTNRYAIGIEAENAGTQTPFTSKPRDPWPAVQVDAYERLCAELVAAGQDGRLSPGRRLSLDAADVRGHKETCYPLGRKVDPLLDMDAFRMAVRRELADRPSRGGPRPAPKPRPTLTRVLRARTPMMRGEDVRAWQKVVGTPADGRFGKGTKRATQVWQGKHHLVSDGIVGPASCDAAGWRWKP
jgi:peptidoglycan hydrolase-like protein with peptidoglycan-binding domain